MERILVELEDLEAGAIRGVAASVGIAGLEPGQKPEALLAAARVGARAARARAAAGRQGSVGCPDATRRCPSVGHGERDRGARLGARRSATGTRASTRRASST